MTTKWILINLLLLVLVGITGRQLYVSVQEVKAENDLSKIQPDPSLNQKIAQETILPPPLRYSRYTASDLAIIPEKNIFSPSRTSGSSSDNIAPTGTMPASQKPTLVGIILMEDRKTASILEPIGRRRNSEARTVQIGDEYAGYTVTDIASDHIVLENGSQKEVISLDDGSQPARRARTNTAPVQMFFIGKGAATGNIPFSAVAGGTRASSPPVPTSRTVNPKTNSNVRNNVVPVSGILPGGAVQQPDTSPQENTPQQENPLNPNAQPPTAAPVGNQRDPRIIRTPFGDILRPDP